MTDLVRGGLVRFVDIEAQLVAYLTAELAARPEPYARDVWVATSVPNPRADRMVILRRDGGARLDLVRETARLTIRVWASGDAEVTDLTGLVRALLAAAPGHGPIRHAAESAGPVTVADESGQPLRMLTVDLTVRATP